jgi:hypothetical protein
MCDRGINTAPTVGRIERRRIDGGVGNRNFRQILARARRLDIGIKWLGRTVSGLRNSDRGEEGCDEDMRIKWRTMVEGLRVHECDDHEKKYGKIKKLCRRCPIGSDG